MDAEVKFLSPSHSNDATGGGAGHGSKKRNAAKSARMIPDVVFCMEQFELAYCKVSWLVVVCVEVYFGVVGRAWHRWRLSWRLVL